MHEAVNPMTRLSQSRPRSSLSCRHRVLSSLFFLLILPILATRCSSDGNTAASSRSSAAGASHSMSNRDWLQLLSQFNKSTDGDEKPVISRSAARMSVLAGAGSSSRSSGSAPGRRRPLGGRKHREAEAVGTSRQRSADRLLRPLPSSNGHLLDITSPLIGSYHSYDSASYNPRRSLGSEPLFRPEMVLAGNRWNPGRSFRRRGGGAAGSLLGSLFRRRRRRSSLQFPRLDAVPPLSAVNSSYTRWSSVTAKDWVEGRNATFMTPVIDQQGVSRRFWREALGGNLNV